VKRIFIHLSKPLAKGPEDHRTGSISLPLSDAAAHFKAGSALSEFMAGRLGAPDCWPNENNRWGIFAHVPNQLTAIQRWENEGGRIIVSKSRLNRTWRSIGKSYQKD
jgi:hypothetical protein